MIKGRLFDLSWHISKFDQKTRSFLTMEAISQRDRITAQLLQTNVNSTHKSTLCLRSFLSEYRPQSPKYVAYRPYSLGRLHSSICDFFDLLEVVSDCKIVIDYFPNTSYPCSAYTRKDLAWGENLNNDSFNNVLGKLINVSFYIISNSLLHCDGPRLVASSLINLLSLLQLQW